jgi:hypothetical protein
LPGCEPKGQPSIIGRVKTIQGTFGHFKCNHSTTATDNLADLALGHADRDRELGLTGARMPHDKPEECTELPGTQRLHRVCTRPKTW